MSNLVLMDLDHNKQRLEYYSQQKEKALEAAKAAGRKASSKSPYDKWIEIYAERVAKLERQVTKLGLRTQLAERQASKALH